MKVGIGTYSFGGFASYLGLGPSLEEKFRLIRSLGFDCVELLPVDLDADVQDIRRWLDRYGLTVTSVHAKPTEEVVKKMAALGGQAVIWAGSPFNCKAEAIELAHELDEMAEMAAPYGIKVGYHNHSQEFYVDEGKPILEYLIENSSKCYFQLDCGWAMNAGTYPPSFIRRYPNRFLAIHVKENCKVQGPGPRPASRHDAPQGNPFGDVSKMSLQQRQKILDDANAHMAEEAKKTPNVQCPMGAPQSNIDWQEVKNALDEQDFEAFWIVEREGFYDADHNKCIAEDCAWIREHIR